VVAVVATVRIDVAAAVPVRSAAGGFSAQVAGLVAPVGPVTAQARATLPVNAANGVTEMVEILPVSAPAAKLRVVGMAVTVKGTTFAVTVVVSVIVPDTPVTVTA
jgi:hypothetical protein